MKKKLASAAVIATMLAFACTGCGDKNSDKKDKDDEIVTEDKDKDDDDDRDDKTEDTEATESVNNDIEDTSEDTEDVEDTEEEEPDMAVYEAQADAIITNVDKMLNAYKNGDIDTLLTYCADDTDMKEMWEKMSNKEAAGEIMKVLFANLDWTYAENCKEELVDYLVDYEEDDTISVNMAIVAPMQLYYKEYYFASLPAGTVLPEDYAPETDEEAMELIKKMVAETPLISEEDLTIGMVKEDGSFQADFDLFFHMDHVEWYSMTSPKSFVKETLDIGIDTEFGAEGTVFMDDDENRAAVEKLVLAKDFNAVAEKCQEVNGEVPGNVHYADLTEEQQKKVDEIIDKEVVVARNAESWVGKNEKRGSILYSYPVKYSGQLSEEYHAWADERNVKDVDIAYDGIGDLKGLTKAFMYDYSKIMEYVQKN